MHKFDKKDHVRIIGKSVGGRFEDGHIGWKVGDQGYVSHYDGECIYLSKTSHGNPEVGAFRERDLVAVK